MGKKKKEKEEVSRVNLNDNNILVTYDDGTFVILQIVLQGDCSELMDALDSDTEDEDTEDEDTEDDGDEDEDEITGESLMEMDYEELEDLVDDEELEVDTEDYEDEEDEEGLRKAIAKELKIKLPKKKKK